MKGNQFIMSDRLYVIPQDEETRLSILSIDRRTKEEVRSVYKIFVEHDWQNNTIANVAIENIIKSLAIDIVNNHESAPINFFNLFSAIVSVKRNEDAEKEGNINISFTHGPIIDDLINNYDGKAIFNNGESLIEEHENLPRLELLITPDSQTGRMPKNGFNLSEKEAIRLAKIERATRMELSDKYSINIPDKAASSLTIAFVFVRNIFSFLLEKMKLSGKSTASVNFNDNIEFHSIQKADQILLTMRPGMNAKLLIKSDETTESEELEDF